MSFVWRFVDAVGAVLEGTDSQFEVSKLSWCCWTCWTCCARGGCWDWLIASNLFLSSSFSCINCCTNSELKSCSNVGPSRSFDWTFSVSAWFSFPSRWSWPCRWRRSSPLGRLRFFVHDLPKVHEDLCHYLGYCPQVEGFQDSFDGFVVPALVAELHRHVNLEEHHLGDRENVGFVQRHYHPFLHGLAVEVLENEAHHHVVLFDRFPLDLSLDVLQHQEGREDLLEEFLHKKIDALGPHPSRRGWSWLPPHSSWTPGCPVVLEFVDSSCWLLGVSNAIWIGIVPRLLTIPPPLPIAPRSPCAGLGVSSPWSHSSAGTAVPGICGNRSQPIHHSCILYETRKGSPDHPHSCRGGLLDVQVRFSHGDAPCFSKARYGLGS